MKKYLFLALAIVSFGLCSCSEDSMSNGGGEAAMPESKVYFNGHAASKSFTLTAHTPKVIPTDNFALNPKTDPGYDTPIDGVKYSAFFYIRIDGNIPGSDASVYPASKYFPRKQGMTSVYSTLNRGYVKSEADWRQNEVVGKYIFAKDGIAVRNVLMQVPSIEDLVAANEVKTDDFSGLLENKDDLHIIWYVCKKQSDGWHVDGILTTKDKKTIDETDFGDDIETDLGDLVDDSEEQPTEGNGEVEIDIHQQDHKDWDEIKTSIHIRDYAGVRVVLPIAKDYQIEQDDFAIRNYKIYYKYDKSTTTFIPAEEGYEPTAYDEDVKCVNVNVIHNTDNITIEVTGIAEELIDNLLENSADGLTIEVHNYVSGISEAALREALEAATIETFKTKGLETPLKTFIYGQVHQKDESVEDWTKIGGKATKRSKADTQDVD